jgi:hypothetical protein
MEHTKVDPKAPASSKVASNPLLFTDNVTTGQLKTTVGSGDTELLATE